MYQPVITFGPPGCGKTTRLLGYLRDELEAGTKPEEIAFVTFGRATRRDVLDRLGRDFAVSRRRWTWVRTIHSAAFRLLGVEFDKLMADEHWREFAERHGYKLTAFEQRRDDSLQEPPCGTRDDRMRYALDWARNRRLDPLAALGKCPVQRVRVGEFETYVRRYRRFKAEHGLRDYLDLLEEVLDQRVCPPTRVSFLDELQDLSPLQIAVVEMWFEGCERSYAAGDDDQAIYEFQGSNPQWMRALAERCVPEFLTLSHRVPRAPHALAQALITKNRDRVEKEYAPTESDGRVVRRNLRQAMALVDGSRPTFVLARNRTSLLAPARLLIENAVPYRIEGTGAPDPLGDAKLASAIENAHAIAQGGFVYLSGLRRILGFVAEQSELVPADARQLVAECAAIKQLFGPADLDREFNLGALVDALQADGAMACFNKLPPWKHRYLSRLLVNGVLPTPQVVLTTIHASKGREADLVVLIPDMSTATFKEYSRAGSKGREAETRVFYVGVTRAKNTLVLVDPQSRKHFDFPRFIADRDAFEERAAIREFEGEMDRERAETASEVVHAR